MESYIGELNIVHIALFQNVKIQQFKTHSNNDNVGARSDILVIRMNMTYKEHQSRFHRGGYVSERIN